MTIYFMTVGAVAYLLILAKATDRKLDDKAFGKLPATASGRIFVGLAALTIVTVGALRWGVGTDYFTYINLFSSYRDSFLTDLRSFNEPGLKGVAWLVANLRGDAEAYLAVASVLTVGLMLWTTTRYSIAVAMSYLLFMFVGNWHGSFNGVRQFMACAVILAGHRFIVERKIVRYILIVLAASAFHISAASMIILYLVPRKRLRPRSLILVFGVAVAALYSSDMVLEFVKSVRGGDWATSEYVTQTINPLRIAVALAPVALYWAHGVRTERDGEWFYRNIAIVHAAVMMAASWSAYLGRFGIYTTAFLPLALPRLIDFRNRSLTLAARAAVVLLFAVFWYVEVSGSSDLATFRFSFSAESQVRR